MATRKRAPRPFDRERIMSVCKCTVRELEVLLDAPELSVQGGPVRLERDNLFAALIALDSTVHMCMVQIWLRRRQQSFREQPDYIE